MTLLALEFTGVYGTTATTKEVPKIHRVMEIEGSLDKAADVRRFIEAFFQQSVQKDADPKSLWRMELAVHETVTNIIRHAIITGGNRTIRIECFAFDDRLSFLITYDGRAFDPQKVPSPRLDGSQTAHFGLYLVDQCMDKIDYQTLRPGEKYIRLVKYVNRDTPL